MPTRAPLEAAYRAGERSSGLLRLLVSTYHYLGLLNEAIAIAKENPQAAAADPALAGVYALAYLDANQAQSAARWATKALAADPNSIDGLTVQATLDASRMHVAHAQERFERVLQLSPENGRAWVGLGTLALLDRNLPRARELLTRGVELMPTHVGSWLVLAWVHLFSRELDSAEQVLQKAAQLDRNFSEVQGGLAAVAALRGDVQGAERGIEVALRLEVSQTCRCFAQFSEGWRVCPLLCCGAGLYRECFFPVPCPLCSAILVWLGQSTLTSKPEGEGSCRNPAQTVLPLSSCNL